MRLKLSEKEVFGTGNSLATYSYILVILKNNFFKMISTIAQCFASFNRRLCVCEPEMYERLNKSFFTLHSPFIQCFLYRIMDFVQQLCAESGVVKKTQRKFFKLTYIFFFLRVQLNDELKYRRRIQNQCFLDHMPVKMAHVT